MVKYACGIPPRMEHVMTYTTKIDDMTSVTAYEDGTMVITRPCIMGGIAVHRMMTTYSPEAISLWLKLRMERKHQPMIQEAFPNMNPEDREFLLSGITPDHWLKMFPKEDAQ